MYTTNAKPFSLYLFIYFFKILSCIYNISDVFKLFFFHPFISPIKVKVLIGFSSYRRCIPLVLSRVVYIQYFLLHSKLHFYIHLFFLHLFISSVRTKFSKISVYSYRRCKPEYAKLYIFRMVISV